MDAKHVKHLHVNGTSAKPPKNVPAGDAVHALIAKRERIARSCARSKLAELATAWWSDRLGPDRQPHTREQNQAILDRLRPTGECWRLGDPDRT